MAKTYEQLMKEADALKARAEVIRKKEAAGVIQKIRVAISHYGFTAADLGLEGGSKGSAPTHKKVKVSASKPDVSNGTPKFRDSTGRSWSGMGPRPGWLKAALAVGKTVEDFRVGAADSATEPAARPNPKAKPMSKTKLPAKYRDQAGNEWSGRGSTPRWVRAAVAEGKTLEQLAV